MVRLRWKRLGLEAAAAAAADDDDRDLPLSKRNLPSFIALSSGSGESDTVPIQKRNTSTVHKGTPFFRKAIEFNFAGANVAPRLNSLYTVAGYS